MAKHRFQSSASVRQQSACALDVPDQTFRFGWIDSTAAIVHLGLGSTSALYRLIEEHGLPYGRLGRVYRFRRDQLDQWVAVRGVEALAAVKAS